MWYPLPPHIGSLLHCHCLSPTKRVVHLLQFMNRFMDIQFMSTLTCYNHTKSLTCYNHTKWFHIWHYNSLLVLHCLWVGTNVLIQWHVSVIIASCRIFSFPLEPAVLWLCIFLLPPNPWQSLFFFFFFNTVSIVLPFPECHMVFYCACVVFLYWLLSLSNVCLRFLHVLA